MGDFFKDHWKTILAIPIIAFVLIRGIAGCTNILTPAPEPAPKSYRSLADLASNVSTETKSTSTSPVAQRAATISVQRTPTAAPTPRPKPTPTFRPRYTPTPDFREYGRNRSQPMPAGKPIEFANGTTISVESVTQNANQIIKRHDAWTDPPPSGHQFLLVEVKVANQGNEPIDIYIVSQLSLVGKSNVSYDKWSGECWTFPNEIDTNRTIFPGGSLSGNICFTVKSSDIDSLVMYLGPDVNGDFAYWSLK